jgi:serine/threonine protein kinase
MALEPTPRNNADMLERLIEDNLNKLPDALRPRWQEKYDAAEEKELPRLARELRALIVERERVTHFAPPMLGSIRHLDTDEARINDTLARIGAAAEREDLFLGKGNFARVFEDPSEPRICYKSITNFSEYGSWNSVEAEAGFLEDLEDLVVDGVRTPRVNTVIDLPTVKIISMEHLNADSIERIISENRTLPAGFDAGRFIKQTRAYISAMHEQRGIYHRDLHGGNVLVDNVNATPYVIDFGKSVRSITPEYAYEARDKTGKRLKALITDEQCLDTLEIRLQQYASGHIVKPE